MSTIITEYQNNELTLTKAWKRYGEELDGLSKTEADQIYDFLWSEIENADASEKQHFALSYAGLVMNNKILPPIRRKE
tara:strand:+ start:285 stop:518 length:234 start_codon:yes stop_codon:yes gene_type:complete